MANASGEDVAEVMRGAANMSKTFDISAKEAMGMVQDGFEVGANANGEFLETLRKYPAPSIIKVVDAYIRFSAAYIKEICIKTAQNAPLKPTHRRLKKTAVAVAVSNNRSYYTLTTAVVTP